MFVDQILIICVSRISWISWILGISFIIMEKLQFVDGQLILCKFRNMSKINIFVNYYFTLKIHVE